MVKVKHFPNSIKYLIFSDGRVFNKELFRFMKPTLREDGRYVISIHGILMLRSRVIALTFKPNPLNLPEVNHKNGKPHIDHDWNLEWVTGKQNIQHAFRTGLSVNPRKT